MATLLLAEDDAGVREISRMVLEDQKHRILEASTGPEAFELLAKHSVDLILLDIMLPGMDGHTILVQLTENPRLKNIPVVIVSALAFARDMFEKFPQVKHFLAKPFTPSDLMTIVHQSLPSGSSHG